MPLACPFAHAPAPLADPIADLVARRLSQPLTPRSISPASSLAFPSLPSLSFSHPPLRPLFLSSRLPLLFPIPFAPLDCPLSSALRPSRTILHFYNHFLHHRHRPRGASPVRPPSSTIPLPLPISITQSSPHPHPPRSSHSCPLIIPFIPVHLSLLSLPFRIPSTFFH